MVRLPTIHSKEELIGLIRELGILPAFACHIPGFSVEDCIDPACWFPRDGEGFWEWKGPVIRESGFAYGKFFSGRAGYLSPALYREFANYRRNGYDFDARWEEGLARHGDKLVFDPLWEAGSLLSKELSRGLPPEARKGFDGTITRLQMQGYALIGNFEYALSRDGTPYGWGLARYETPEHFFGPEFREKVYEREPEESRAILYRRLREILPDEPEKAINRLIG